MLFYRDHIPDLEQCNINGEDDDVDDNTLYMRQKKRASHNGKKQERDREKER